MPQSPLQALLTSACHGDDASRHAAFAELMRLAQIFVRAGMGRGLRRHRDSVDVCQSLARSFIDDYDAGRIRFESEGALVAYLQAMVRTKLAMLARHDRAAMRDVGRQTVLGSTDAPAADARLGRTEPTASLDQRSREARERALRDLSPVEAELVQLRFRGLEWETIAEQLGQNAPALRQQFSRLKKKLEQALGGSNQAG